MFDLLDLVSVFSELLIPRNSCRSEPFGSVFAFQKNPDGKSKLICRLHRFSAKHVTSMFQTDARQLNLSPFP
jgi:hypothetical protein